MSCAGSVGLEKLVEKMELKNLTPDIDMTERVITVPDINRPALQLTGFFDHFDSERIQVIGYVVFRKDAGREKRSHIRTIIIV